MEHILYRAFRIARLALELTVLHLSQIEIEEA